MHPILRSHFVKFEEWLVDDVIYAWGSDELPDDVYRSAVGMGLLYRCMSLDYACKEERAVIFEAMFDKEKQPEDWRAPIDWVEGLSKKKVDELQYDFIESCRVLSEIGIKAADLLQVGDFDVRSLKNYVDRFIELREEIDCVKSMLYCVETVDGLFEPIRIIDDHAKALISPYGANIQTDRTYRVLASNPDAYWYGGVEKDVFEGFFDA